MDVNRRLPSSQHTDSKNRQIDSEAMEAQNQYSHEDNSHINQSNGITFLLCVSTFGAICGSGLVYGYNLSVLNNPEVSLP